MKPIKTYSVWINLAAAIVGGASAVVQYLQGLDPSTSLTVAALGVVTVIARHWPQTDKAPQ